MRGNVHDGFNSALRLIMADMIGGDLGGWGLYGAYWRGDKVSWESLDGLIRAVTAHISGRIEEAGEVGVADLYDVLDTLADTVPAGAFGADLAGLRGIALACNVTGEDGERSCAADAAFDDGHRHQITWEADAATPESAILTPVEIDRSGLLFPPQIPNLLAAILAKRGPSRSPLSETQQRLSAVLRGVVADRIADGASGIFVILDGADNWEVIPPSDLVDQLAALTESGQTLGEALTAMAAEREALLAADPSRAIGVVKGMGTIMHAETEDGSACASLAAYCDQTWHAVMWNHTEAAPDWEIIPAPEADSDTAESIAIYARLTAAINGSYD